MAATATYDATVTAAGTAVVRISPGSRARTWVVSQVSVEMRTAPAGAECELRLRGALVTLLVAQADTAGGDPPVTLLGTDVMTVEWSACTPGDVGHVLILYSDRAAL